jgi:hypothetical protein
VAGKNCYKGFLSLRMKIELDNIQPEQKKSFFDGLFFELKKYPFGSMSKRDLDCLILNLMRQTGITGGNNRDMSNALGKNETKLKTYLIDGRYKYNNDEKEKNIQISLICQVISLSTPRRLRPYWLTNSAPRSCFTVSESRAMYRYG